MTIFSKAKDELTTYHKTHKKQLELADMERLVNKYPDAALDILFRRYAHGENWVHETCHEIEKNSMNQRVNRLRAIHHRQGDKETENPNPQLSLAKYRAEKAIGLHKVFDSRYRPGL